MRIVSDKKFNDLKTLLDENFSKKIRNKYEN